MLLMTFFLQLPGNKYHVNCAAPMPEITLRQDKICHMLQETDERAFGQHFACHREMADATTVATFCSVTLFLLYKKNDGIFQILWETLGGPAVRKKIMLPLM